MIINWDSLPHDVLYVAQNQSGEWVGFRSKPVISTLECWVSSDIKETYHLLGIGDGQSNDNWEMTLQVRPNCFYERANMWLKNAYPGLVDYEIRANSDELFFTANTNLDFFEELAPDDLKLTIAPPGFSYVIARKHGKDDVILLMPNEM